MPFSAISELRANTPGALFAYGQAKQNFLLHWPASISEKVTVARGTVIFIHGGCWSNEFDLEHSNPFASQLAEASYNVWSIEYRRVGDSGGGWPGTLEDVLAAIDYVLTQAPSAPVTVVGHSAGGHLALLAGAKRTEQIDKVIGLAAIARMQQYGRGNSSCESMVRRFMGYSPPNGPTSDTPSINKKEEYAKADPAFQTLHPSTLLLQGTADQIVPIEQTEIPGAKVRLVENAGHFDWLHPETDAFNVLLESLNEPDHD